MENSVQTLLLLSNNYLCVVQFNFSSTYGYQNNARVLWLQCVWTDGKNCMALHGITTNKIFVGPLNSVMSAAAVVPALCNRSALQIPPAYLSFLSHTGNMHILPKKSIPSTNIELKQHNFDHLKMWYLYLITSYGTIYTVHVTIVMLIFPYLLT